MIWVQPMARVVYLENGKERIIYGNVHIEGEFTRIMGTYGFGIPFDIKIHTSNLVSIKE